MRPLSWRRRSSSSPGCGGQTSPASPAPSPPATPGPAETRSGAAAPAGALSVLTFGATGDGVSLDDTAAVAVALREATAKGRVLWLPEGTYVVTDLVVPDGALVSGTGGRQAWLKGRLEVGGRCVFTDVKLDAAAPPCTSSTARPARSCGASGSSAEAAWPLARNRE